MRQKRSLGTEFENDFSLQIPCIPPPSRELGLLTPAASLHMATLRVNKGLRGVMLEYMQLVFCVGNLA